MRGLLKKTMTGACAAWLLAGVAVAAERADDDKGLIEALAATVNGDGYGPFLYSSTAIIGGNVGSQTGNAIVRELPNTWAPERIYQLERYGASTVVLSRLRPNATYCLELHLSENYFGTSAAGGGGGGSRVFNVRVNGTLIEERLDIFKEAGGVNKALCKQYDVAADADGKVTIKFENINDNAHFSGVAIFGSEEPATPTLVCPKPSGSFDLAFSWATVPDTLRYYLQRAATASGPWTDMGVYTSGATNATFAGAYDPMETVHYRLVASNGVGATASSTLSFAPDASDRTSLKTRGEQVASNPAALYYVDRLGSADDPVNRLATDVVSVNAYLLDLGVESALAVGDGQTLSADVVGVNATGGTLAVTGTGAVSPRNQTLALNAAETGTLRLETDVSSSAGNGALAKNGAGTAVLAGGLTGFPSVAVNAGTLAYETAADATFASTLTGTGAFEKRGAGRLTVMSKNTAFAGDVCVAEGTLRLGTTGSQFPDTTGTLTVKTGAALDVGAPGATAQGVNLGKRKVVVGGQGSDGRGAIVNDSGIGQYNALSVGELANDVTFGGTSATKSETVSRWDFRNGSLAMNGHNIEKVGSNMVCLTGIALTEGGPVKIDVKEGYWSSETSTSYSGGPENAFNIYTGATLDFYGMSNPITWAVNLADGAELKFRSGGTNHNHITGPVTLAGGTNTVTLNWGIHGRLAGPVKESAPTHLRVKGGWGKDCLWLENAENDWTGGTWIESAAVHAASKGALPGYGDPARLVLTNSATVILPLGTGAWETSDVSAMLTGGALRTADSRVGVDVAADTVTVADELSSLKGGLSKYGAGALVQQGKLDFAEGSLRVEEGTLVLDGTASFFARSAAVLGGGTLVLTNDATFATQMDSGFDMNVGGTAGSVAEVVVTDGATLKADRDCTINQPTASIRVGVGNNDRGVLTVQPGGTVAHKVNVGLGGPYAQGAVIQNGGFVQNQGGANNDIRVGDAGYGYYELNAGELDWWGYGSIGGATENVAAKGMGVMVQHGGTFRYVAKHTAGRIGICRGSSGVYYNDGGLLDAVTNQYPCAFILGETDNPHIRGTTSTFTLDGPSAVAQFSSGAHLGNRPEHTAVINVNAGGTLSCGTIASRPNYASSNIAETIRGYVNFDGGVFRAPATMQLFSTASNQNPNAVTVYKGGVVFDVTNAAYTLTVSQPLRAPTGQGVASITAPTALLNATGYIGAPFVKITGGGGEGATAVALYDSKTRKVTGIRVTSAGTGYTSAPTVTATGGGFTNVHVCTATLAVNATTGGLVKRGAGTLVLAAANTFGGDVTLEEGRLSFAASNALPAGAALTVRQGSISSLYPLACRTFTKTGDGTVELAPGTSFAAGRTIDVKAGTLKSAVSGPGLVYEMLSGAGNWTGAFTAPTVALGPVMANSREGWPEQVTAVYRGYIWNRTSADATWTFIEHFDDVIRLWIDGELVLDNGSWNTPSKTTVTLAPGPHLFELRLSQGAGGAGPCSEGATVTDADGTSYKIQGSSFGFMVDWQGRDSFNPANYEKPVDPGNGSLFTITATDNGVFPADTTLNVADGATVALGAQSQQSVAGLAGVGTVASGSLRPTGTWTLDADDFTAGRHLTLADGTLDLSAVTELAFENAAALPLRGTYVIAEASDGFTGDMTALTAQMKGLPKGAWRLSVSSSGKQLRLVYPSGTCLIFR